MPVCPASPSLRPACPVGLLMAAGLAAVVGCGTTEPRRCGRGPFPVTVSAGDQPTFTWRSDCHVAYVRVDADEVFGGERDSGFVGQRDVWSVGDPLGRGGDNISPPLRYAGPPLVRGRRYTVTLESVEAGFTGCGLLSFCVPAQVGSASFVP